MRLELDQVALGDGPGAPLPAVSVVADRRAPGFVAVETEGAPTLASLVAGGRMAPDQGRVTLDGRDDADAVRASFALVDTPTVAEPFGTLTVSQVTREELALAGHRAGRASAREFLEVVGLTEHHGTRLASLPTELRVRLLCELALLRPGIEGLVLTSPERHGGDVAAWLGVVHDLARRGVVVLTVTGFAALAAVRALPVPDLGEDEPEPDAADTDADADTTDTDTLTTDTLVTDDSAVAPTPGSPRP
jgi:ABC-2 type transport system ATP-binding protein